MQDEVGGVFLLFHHPRPQQEAFFVLLLNKTKLVLQYNAETLLQISNNI